ncbi:MAG: hypothetical protein M1522_05120 [Actinobacteria bacterium]|nr:hypothetical protein [Actinomycetota bacterium]
MARHVAVAVHRGSDGSFSVFAGTTEREAIREVVGGVVPLWLAEEGDHDDPEVARVLAEARRCYEAGEDARALQLWGEWQTRWDTGESIELFHSVLVGGSSLEQEAI